MIIDNNNSSEEADTQFFRFLTRLNDVVSRKRLFSGCSSKSLFVRAPAHPGVPGKRAVRWRVCVCVTVLAISIVC